MAHWRGRHRELLSDVEWDGFLFSTLITEVVDIREQFKLSQKDSRHELVDYDIRFGGQDFPGTIACAEQLKIKHPWLKLGDESVSWVMTTDLLLLIRAPGGPPRLVAVSIKPDKSSIGKRSRALLNIERTYWLARSVQWLLITPDLFDQAVGLCLRRTAPWGLGTPATQQAIQIACAVAKEGIGGTLSSTIDTLAQHFKSQDLALRAFWQAVWTGLLPLDLRRGWRPHLPIELLSRASFIGLNPIASGRSSWI
jgi:hypothetical protein